MCSFNHLYIDFVVIYKIYVFSYDAPILLSLKKGRSLLGAFK